MLILSIHIGEQDSAAALLDDYVVLAAVSQERLNRIKGAGGFPDLAIAEVLRLGGVSASDVDALVCPSSVGMGKDLGALLGLRDDCRLYASHHHFSHALPSLFFTDWDQALLYTADGGGDGIYSSHTLFQQGRLERLYGGHGADPQAANLGLVYGAVTNALGWRSNRHEGKLTGLAAHGRPTLLQALLKPFQVEDGGRIIVSEDDPARLVDYVQDLARSDSPENAASSVQALLDTLIHRSVSSLLRCHQVKHLGLSGGVFANVRLNRVLAETLPIDELFVVPPMGDEGLVLGGALAFLLERDGLPVWLSRRYRLSDVCWGASHDETAAAIFDNCAAIRRWGGEPADQAALWLAEGKIGAIFSGRMEFGPRALGARSILASPVDGGVNQRLNDRLERSDFMPFAPVVADANAADVFDLTSVNAYAARFMTVTCAVRPAWRDKIPAVVHVDGTARPQVIRRSDHPLYYDLLESFKKRTGLPVLVNTSFNAHEEPIINRPEEALRALQDHRIDFLVTPQGLWTLL